VPEYDIFEEQLSSNYPYYGRCSPTYCTCTCTRTAVPYTTFTKIFYLPRYESTLYLASYESTFVLSYEGTFVRKYRIPSKVEFYLHTVLYVSTYTYTCTVAYEDSLR